MWEWNTCCIYHMELNELKLGLNNMRGQGNSTKVCKYHKHEVCAPCKGSYKGITCLWEFVVCLKGDFDEWHKKECLYGDCPHCGVQKLYLCLEEKNSIDEWLVQCRCYVLEQTRLKNGKPLKKLTPVYNNTSSNEFIKYLKPKFQHFLKHNFVARWQDKHFKTCVKSFSKDYILFVVDFVENYNFQV